MLQHQLATAEGHSARQVLHLQVYLGLAWISGCLLFGFLILVQSKECNVSRQYLCQAALLMTGICVLLLTVVDGYSGYVIFVWFYGICYGGYSYCLKMYIYEKVRARNFARAWGFAQFSMAVPNFFGMPLSAYMTVPLGKKAGFYLSASAIIAGSLLMSLIDVHKRNLRNKNLRHKLHQDNKKSLMNGFIIASAPHSQLMDPGSCNSQGQVSMLNQVLASPSFVRKSIVGSEPGGGERRLSFSEQDDMLPPVSLLSHQRSFIYDDIIGDLQSGRNNDQLSLFSESQGIADMEMPDHLLFMDELEYLDNITSCAKVENCLMLSEYEQNLIKETESPAQQVTRRRLLWPFGARQSSNYLLQHNQVRRITFFMRSQMIILCFQPAPSEVPPGSPMPVRATLGVGGWRQSSFYGDLPLTLPATVSNGSSSSKRNKRSAAKDDPGIPAPAREIPMFSNTARRLQQRNRPSRPQKRSITVIEEASV